MKIKAIYGVCILLAIIYNSEAQDKIFRKNGVVIEAFDLTETGKSRSYRLANDAPDIKRYISTAVIDSIIYENGKKDVFLTPVPEENTDLPEVKSFRRNFLSFDFGALLFFKSWRFAYEYLPGKGYTGLYASFTANSNPASLYQYEDINGFQNSDKIYDSMGRLLNWSGRVGVNQYIFPPGMYRLAAGLYWITGRYEAYKSRALNEEPYYEYNHLKNQPLNGIVFSPTFCVELVQPIQFRGGIEIPLYTNTKMSRSFIRFDASINF